MRSKRVRIRKLSTKQEKEELLEEERQIFNREADEAIQLCNRIWTAYQRWLSSGGSYQTTFSSYEITMKAINECRYSLQKRHEERIRAIKERIQSQCYTIELLQPYPHSHGTNIRSIGNVDSLSDDYISSEMLYDPIHNYDYYDGLEEFMSYDIETARAELSHLRQCMNSILQEMESDE